MFENLNFGSGLSEDRFDEWLESGRQSKIRFHYIVILWDEIERDYRPVYIIERAELEKYKDYRGVGEALVAVYDLYTESKIM